MPKRCDIAESPADLEQELISLADRLSSRSIIFTDPSHRRDLEAAAAGLRELAGINRMVDRGPVIGQTSTPAAPAVIERAAVTACPCRDRCMQALQRWGIQSDEAREIVGRMFAAPDRLALWLEIEPKFREMAHQRQARHGGTAPGRPTRPDSAPGRLRDLAAQLLGVGSRTAGRMLDAARAAACRSAPGAADAEERFGCPLA